MKRIQLAGILLAFAGAAAGAAGCGDSGQTCGAGTVAMGDTCVPESEIECGPGTVLEGDECVPEGTLECGAGTVEMDGQCVPDGTVICEQGTAYDADSGTCVVDPSACAAGTVLVAGECVPEDDTLPGMADHTEGAEPNGPGDANLAGNFAAPAIGSNVTFYGCVDPSEDPVDGDLDTWIVTTTGPAVLDITVDGIGGLVAGFAMVDANGNALLNTWQRLGLNLTGDTAHRQIYVPTAGAWGLFVTDGRTLFFGEAAGDDDSCYFGTVTQAAIPAPVALTVPQTAAQDNGTVKIYSYNADQVADILDLTITETSGALSPGALVSRNGTLIAVLAEDAAGNPPFFTQGGLNTTGDTIQIVWDAEYNFALAPQAFAIDSFDIAAQALPTDGSQITITKHNGTTPTAPYVDLNYLYFDVATPAIYHWNLTPSVAVDMQIVRRDVFTPAGAFDTFANINAFGSTGAANFQGQFTRFLTPGRYYFVVQDPAGVAGATFTLTNTLVAMTPTAVTYGTPTAAVALPAQGSGFHTLDLTNPVWSQFGATATDWAAANVVVEGYDAAGQGWMTTSVAGNYAPVFTGTQPAAGTTPFGRVLINDSRDFVLRVRPSAVVGAAPMYSLAIGDRPHTNLMTLTAGTPITRSNLDALAATTGSARFVVSSAAGNQLSVVADPSDALGDLRIRRFNADETVAATINAGGVGANETLGAAFGPGTANWVAFSVDNLAATATNLDPLTLSATVPLPYVDICPTGTQLITGGDDEFIAVQTLPAAFTFNFFGVAQTQVIPGANGFLAFGATNPACASTGCWQTAAIPNAAAPNNLVAPHWADLASVRICRKDEATKVTFQWTGVLYNTTTAVAFQAVLNTSGQIDFIYGPGQVGNGSTATVGVENSTGTIGTQVSRNVAGSVLPSSSVSLTTPAP